jgi:SepF-like predicted cell division protein (DUF552 family)
MLITAIEGCTVTILKKKPFPAGEENSPRDSISAEQYIDLTEMTFDEDELGGIEGATSLVKVGELFRYEDLSALTKEVYDGNMVIVDYTSIANDDLTMKRVTAELKNVARDVDGDVAGVGKNLLMATPRGIKIDRNKMKGGF